MNGQDMIFLRLEGPLQSWGEHSKFDYRDTADMPSKSGVIGMIGCAMGLPRGSDTLKTISDNLKIAFRCDRKGSVSQDYHTVSAPNMIMNAQGKPRCKTIVTHRYYLEDASYLAVMSGPKELLDQIADAFSSPIWPIYLGRKCCIPDRPVYIKRSSEYKTFEEAMENEPLCQRHSEDIFYEIDSSTNEGYIRTDSIYDAKKRYYYGRRVLRLKKES